MKCVIRHVIFAALLLLTFAAPASAQYMYMDTNANGVSDPGDRMAANGTPTTVDLWINTNHNRDGSLAECNTADGDLGTWNSYVANIHASSGTVSYSGMTNQQPSFTIVSTITAQNETDLTFGRAAGAPEAGGLERMFTVTVTGQTGAPRLDLVPFSNVGNDPTSFGTACSGQDFDNTYKLGTDWFDVDGVGPPVGGNANPVITAPASVSGAEGSSMSITGSATDPDAADLVTLSQTNNAPFLAGPASAGPSANPSITLTGTPNFSQAGSYVVNWSATDNRTPAGT